MPQLFKMDNQYKALEPHMSIKKLLRLFFLLLLTWYAGVSVSLAAPSPSLDSRSWILIDRLTDTVLSAKNEKQKLNPGNTVLLMVLYTSERALATQNIERTKNITVNNDALSIPPLNASRIYLEPNRTVSYEYLEKAIAVMGANDAAVALAEGIATTIDRFVEMMNENAVRLGMNDTHYVSPIGSNNKEQYTTAKDTLILANALLNEFPSLNDYWTIDSISNGVIQHQNTNSLLWRTPSIKGMHSSEFAMKYWSSLALYSRDYVEGETRFARELIAVNMGSDSAKKNADDTMRLITWGADNYKTLLLYPALETIEKIPVAVSDDAKVRVGVNESIYVTLPRDTILKTGEKGFSVKLNRLDPLVAPIKEGEKVGDVIVYFDEKEVARSDLIALHDVQQSNFWRRQFQRIKAIFGLQ